MLYLDLTLTSLAENLALDEALLLAADQHRRSDVEVLRIWQPRQTAVILGRSSRVAEEIHLDLASQLGVDVLRRSSGGASVVIGPGCLLYSVLIDLRSRPQLRGIDQMHQFVMTRMLQGLNPIVQSMNHAGTCDLIVDQCKISGNSLKVGRNWTLYHGTLLLNMDLPLVSRLLKHPPREPDYRQGRSHDLFLRNLKLDSQLVARSLQSTWQADEPLHSIPNDLVQQLVESRYGQEKWTYQR